MDANPIFNRACITREVDIDTGHGEVHGYASFRSVLDENFNHTGRMKLHHVRIGLLVLNRGQVKRMGGATGLEQVEAAEEAAAERFFETLPYVLRQAVAAE